MRTIKRDIVGAYIFSTENRLLLGINKKGGAYSGMCVVPGGGVDDGETKEEALAREILEETGIDISDSEVMFFEQDSGSSNKTLRDTGEEVFVEMIFYKYIINLNKSFNDIDLKFEDDFGPADWYSSEDVGLLKLSPPTETALRKMKFLK